MTSIQDALTEALEHPITDPPIRRKGEAKRHADRQAEDASDPYVWAFLGAAGALLAFGIYQLLSPRRLR